MIYAAILAGGSGKRIERYSIPKQYIALSGTPIIIYTIRTFLKNPRIDKIFIAVHPDWETYLFDLLSQYFSESEIESIHLVKGGKERLDSFSNIVDAIYEEKEPSERDILICHDSVRPFVRQQMIDDCIDATLEDNFALTVIPTTDTIHVAQDEKFIEGTLDRRLLYNGQNPAGFNIRLLHNALNSFTKEAKDNVTGTTQLILKLGYRIRIVRGHTSNFKITTDNDLDIADRIIRSMPRTRSIRLLDCTLRDGGIVLDFNFGKERMDSIITSLEKSGVDYIECGYINDSKGSASERSCFRDVASVNQLISSHGKNPNTKYLAMIDYGTFNLDLLPEASSFGLDGIRFAFHKENWKEAIECGKKILQKGYELFIQPMVTLRYSDSEYKELISICNRELPQAKAFYIVDSFGQMDNISLMKRLEIADQYVLPSMAIGFHAHNNRQMAFSNACSFVQTPTNHDIMLDSSIMGIGKGAGNLCTELIIPVLISEGNYYDTVEIYKQITSYFSELSQKISWGYCLEYYLSSLYGCTPSYIKIFMKDSRVSTDILIDLLQNMPETKKAACDKQFADEYLNHYFGSAK